ncbi:MAG TPA: cupin domain-containing protein [Anaeromyxobacteraceae bacterium]|nr:cupin domain-containing protein [Anaeromyxobacteraceae bacterium]
MDAQPVFSRDRKIGLDDALKRLQAGSGTPWAEVFRHGSLQIEIFAPQGTDPQTPHRRDEIYVVARGRGWFVSGDRRIAFSAGDVLFAAAGEVHRFEKFSTDFCTWVLFFGPEGGEKPKRY